MSIDANYTNLMNQAPDTVDVYLDGAITSIDKRFGKGYAAEHPELVAAFIKSAAADFNNASMIIAVQEASERIAGALELAGRAIQAGLESSEGL